MEADSTFDKTLEEDNTVEGAKRAVKNQGVDRAIDQADDLLKNFKLDGSVLLYEDSDAEVVEVEEGHAQGEPELGLCSNNSLAKMVDNQQNQPQPPAAPVVVDYDAENKEDGEKSQDQARQIKIEFSPNDIKFWFAQLEDEMSMASIGT